MNEKKLWCNNYTLTPVCKWWLEEFAKLDGYFVNVNCCVFLDGKGGYFEPPDKVYLAQDLPDGRETVQALFHELRHYYQFKTGMWTDFNPKPYQRDLSKCWTELERMLERYVDYLNYPWEMDARENSMEALRAFWKSPVSAPFASSSKPTLLSRVLGRR